MGITYKEGSGRIEVKKGEKVIGAIKWGVNFCGFWEIWDLYIDSYYQGNGYGRELVDRVKAGIGFEKAIFVEAGSREGRSVFVSALNFWEHMGFYDAPKKYLQPSLTSVTMVYGWY